MPLPTYLDPNIFYWLTDITGTEGADMLTGNYLSEEIKSLGGDDIVSGGGGNDHIELGAGNDWGGGGTGDDTLYGQAGDDFLVGETGNDHLYGGEGHDELYGAEGDDIAYGEAGNDYLEGGEGADSLWGGEGNDVVEGSWGDDHLYGGAGNDILQDAVEFSGAHPYGRDWYDGGDGDDRLVVENMDDALGEHLIDGGTGFDRLEFDGEGQVIMGLGALAANTTGVEAIGLGGTSSALLIVNPRDVLDFSAEHTLFVTGGHDFVIPGAAQMSVVMSDHSDGNFWTYTGTVGAFGNVFNHYQSVVDGQQVQLYVDTWLQQSAVA